MDKQNRILSINNISKAYGDITALQHVHIHFEKHGIYGLFGRNGAGKTTLLDIISARIYADAGTVTCMGEDIAQHPAIIAENCCYIPEKHFFPGSFKIKTLLSLAQGSFQNYDPALEERLCHIFALNIEQKYKGLSRGYQSIFRIVLGLSSTAPITIFDEPGLGLDAVARDQFYQELIRAYGEKPRLFIFSTHLIEESADLFNEAIIIHNGTILQQASVEALLANSLSITGNADKVDDFLKGKNVLSAETVDTMKTAVIRAKLEAQPPTPGLRFSPMTIQKLFIQLTNSQNEQE